MSRALKGTKALKNTYHAEALCFLLAFPIMIQPGQAGRLGVRVACADSLQVSKTSLTIQLSNPSDLSDTFCTYLDTLPETHVGPSMSSDDDVIQSNAASLAWRK
jgi:hypothetical protein